jgi:hypothetical protein
MGLKACGLSVESGGAPTASAGAVAGAEAEAARAAYSRAEAAEAAGE